MKTRKILSDLSLLLIEVLTALCHPKIQLFNQADRLPAVGTALMTVIFASFAFLNR
jgi:hypothetical protein